MLRTVAISNAPRSSLFMKRRVGSRVLRVGLAALCVCAVHAQNRTTAELIGTVTDPSGAMLPGAAVTATNVQTKATFPVTTNQAGYYDVPFLPPGTYADHLCASRLSDGQSHQRGAATRPERANRRHAADWRDAIVGHGGGVGSLVRPGGIATGHQHQQRISRQPAAGGARPVSATRFSRREPQPRRAAWLPDRIPDAATSTGIALSAYRPRSTADRRFYRKARIFNPSSRRCRQ